MDYLVDPVIEIEIEQDLPPEDWEGQQPIYIRISGKTFDTMGMHLTYSQASDLLSELGHALGYQWFE
jgi:hypothetical protein